MTRKARLLFATAIAATIGSEPARAEAEFDIARITAEIEVLRSAQAASFARISQLETVLKSREVSASLPEPTWQAGSPHGPASQQVAATADRSAAAPVNPAGGSAPGMPPASTPSKLSLNGDLRLRYESNFGDKDARNRDRGVLRARLRAAYAVSDWLTVGGQIATGDADDPNSSDITLSNFDDDLDASLDQAYARLSVGNLLIYGGKIPQPFVRTELVWDGDVNPQGVSASYRLNLGGGGASLRANALYFLIDESVAGKNSDMIGGQLAFESATSAPVKLELAAGYYDYQLASTAGGDTGDFRSNRFATGRYLSDFNLLDVIGAVQYNGLGALWPVRLVGDYTHNFGATTSQNEALGIDLLVGRASRKGDWRFGYGYARTGVDAVFAAFSQDNTNIATNYVQHSLSADFVPADRVILNATYYRYRPKTALYAGTNATGDWLDRLRFNFLVTF